MLYCFTPGSDLGPAPSCSHEAGMLLEDVDTRIRLFTICYFPRESAALEPSLDMKMMMMMCGSCLWRRQMGQCTGRDCTHHRGGHFIF